MMCSSRNFCGLISTALFQVFDLNCWIDLNVTLQLCNHPNGHLLCADLIIWLVLMGFGLRGINRIHGLATNLDSTSLNIEAIWPDVSELCYLLPEVGTLLGRWHYWDI